MKIPSKRAALIAEAENRRKAAFTNNDSAAFAQAIADIQALEGQPDEYTCLGCGRDFTSEPHVDLLVANILVFDSEQVTDRADYNITTVGETGRRIKFCNNCVSAWPLPVLEYVEVR